MTCIYHAVSCYADDGSESEPAAEPPAAAATATTADTREKRKKGVADKREKKERCSCNKADHTYQSKLCYSDLQCFEPISKQPKQTELFRNKLKQTETNQNFLKNTQIYSLLNCLCGSSVCFRSVKSKHRNSLFRYRSETTETNCTKKDEKTKKNGKTLNFL